MFSRHHAELIAGQADLLFMRKRQAWRVCGFVVIPILLASCKTVQTDCVAQLPNPSGSFAVARRGYGLIDSARPDRFSSDSTKHRELMVHVWYPAQQSNHASFEGYVPGAKQIDGSACGRVRMRDEFEAIWPHILSGQLGSHVVASATPAVQPGGFPVVLFSHGLGSTTFAYSSQIEDLVSHGYVVIAIEHTDMATAVLFPDGRIRCFQRLPATGSGDALEQMIAAMKEEVQTGAEDIRFVLDNLMKRSIAVPVSLDLEHVAAMGHSAGGTMVARACQIDKRIKACISEDGELKGIAAFADYPDHAALTQPFLLMEIYLAPTDGELARMRLTRQQWQAYEQKKRQQLQSCQGGSYDVVFNGPGMIHASFSDEPLLGAPCGSSARALALDNLLLIEKTTRAFLSKYLRGEPAPLLDQPGNTPPNVTVQRFGRQLK